MPEETQGYKLNQPKQSLTEYQNMGMSISLLNFTLKYVYPSHSAIIPTSIQPSRASRNVAEETAFRMDLMVLMVYLRCWVAATSRGRGHDPELLHMGTTKSIE